VAAFRELRRKLPLNDQRSASGETTLEPDLLQRYAAKHRAQQHSIWRDTVCQVLSLAVKVCHGWIASPRRSSSPRRRPQARPRPSADGCAAAQTALDAAHSPEDFALPAWRWERFAPVAALFCIRGRPGPTRAPDGACVRSRSCEGLRGTVGKRMALRDAAAQVCRSATSPPPHAGAHRRRAAALPTAASAALLGK